MALATTLCLLYSCNNQSKSTQQIMIKPPITKKVPKELTIHNHTRVDNYFWLNFYRLKLSIEGKKAGHGRTLDFPKFLVFQYEY